MNSIYEGGSWQNEYMSMGCELLYFESDDNFTDDENDFNDRINTIYKTNNPQTCENESTLLSPPLYEPDPIAPDAIPFEFFVPNFSITSFK